MAHVGMQTTGSTRSIESNVPPILPQLISVTLRLGVAISATLILLGLGLLLSGPAVSFTNATVQGVPFSLSGLILGVSQGRAADVLLLGFLVLIATPLVRVMLSAVMFATAGDRAFTILTVSVLLLLGVSVLLGAVP